MREPEFSVEAIYKLGEHEVIGPPDYLTRFRAFDTFVDTFFEKIRAEYGDVPQFLIYDKSAILDEATRSILAAKVYGVVLGIALRNWVKSYSEEPSDYAKEQYFSESAANLAKNEALLELAKSMSAASYAQADSEQPLDNSLDCFAEIFIVDGHRPSEKDRKTVKECAYQAFLAAKKEYTRMSSSMRTLLGMLFLLVGIPLAIAYFVAKYLRLKASP